MAVFFHSEETDFSLKDVRGYTEWINAFLAKESLELGELSIIFTSNEYLLKINRAYLNHDYFTDVITFDYSNEEVISGDVFISVDQVKINAEEYKVKFDEELSRVIIHGVLHLMGYGDSNEEERIEMRKMEDHALALLK